MKIDFSIVFQLKSMDLCTYCYNIFRRVCRIEEDWDQGMEDSLLRRIQHR